MRWLVLGLLLAGAFVVPMLVSGQGGLVTNVPVVDPSGTALDAFHAALRDEGRKARVVVYGASHTAGDIYTGELRRRLQREFGDGGPGWVLPGAPFTFYDHTRVEVEGDGWAGLKVRGRERRRDDYGYAGFAVEGTNATSLLVPDRSVQHVEVHYLRAPGRGSLEVSAGGVERRVSARGPRSFERLVVDADAGQVALRTRGAVRVFGVALETASAGVVVDAFGVPGARVWDQDPWRDGSLRAHLDDRPPDLVALAYGTNEAANRRVRMADYRRRLTQALRRWKRRAPQASCLLIGPGEWPRRRRGEWIPRPRIAQVIGVQKAVAAAQGCAFFDAYAMMGGEGSMARWVAAGLGLSDHVHLTDEGYRRMGAALHRAIRPR